MSTRLGMTAQEYQAWTGVFSEADLDLSGSTRAFNTFFKTLEEGSEDAVEGLARLGINYDEFMQLGTSDKMYQLVSGFQALAATGVDVRTLAQTFFGSAQGTNMLTLLAGSGLDSAFSYYNGIAAGDNAVSQSAAFNDSLTKLNTLLDAIKLDMFAPVLEHLTSAIEGITDFLMIITGRKTVSGDEIVDRSTEYIAEQAAAAGVELVQRDMVEENDGDTLAAQRQAVLDLYYALRNSGELTDAFGG